MVPLLKAKRSGSAVYAGEFEDGYAAFAKKNYAVAMAYFKHAAAQGDADAQYSLGHMYDKRLGVVQDYAEAVKLYRLAAQGEFALPRIPSEIIELIPQAGQREAFAV